jgi:multisubunit Na+/H+ antiporter MnhC subunit
VVLSYLIPLVYSFLRKPILHERYTIIALPALFLLVSLGISLLPKRQVRTAVIAAIFVSTAINLVFFNRYYTRITKNQFREVSQEVIKKNVNRVKVYSDQAWHYGFYFSQYKAPYPLNDALGIDFQQALATEQQVWVLRGHILKGVDEAQQKYLDEHFELKDQIIRHDASAYLYARK